MLYLMKEHARSATYCISSNVSWFQRVKDADIELLPAGASLRSARRLPNAVVRRGLQIAIPVLASLLACRTGPRPLAVSPPLAANDSAGAIRGVVTTTDGQPVHGAQISFTFFVTPEDGSARSSGSATTDEHGRFLFPRVMPREITLRITAPWRRGVSQAVRVERGRILTLHIELTGPTKEDWLLVRGSRCPSTGGLLDAPVGGSIVTVGDSVSGAGLVCFITLEGGFYAVLGTDGRMYDPINLPQAMRHDSLPVVFRGHIRRDVSSIHRVGPLVELAEIRPRPPVR